MQDGKCLSTVKTGGVDVWEVCEAITVHLGGMNIQLHVTEYTKSTLTGVSINPLSRRTSSDGVVQLLK